MTCRDLRDFLDLLEIHGELHKVAAEVDPLLEIAAVTARVCKSRNNRALLFGSVKGSGFRVVTNFFGSEQRLSLALGVARLADLTGWFDRLLAELPGAGAVEKLLALSADPRWSAAEPEFFPAPVHLQAAAIDLGTLPILRNQPLDGQPDHEGRFMTLPLVITADSGFSAINCGMYRTAAADAGTLLLKWNSRSGAAVHAASWADRAEPMPIVIALGGPPALTFAATLPLPAFLDELTFTGLLQGEPVKVFKCGNGLVAPLGAEIVIEGYLEAAEVSDCGAFANHSGFYTASEPAAVVRVTAIRQRQDLILPATVVGKPPMEDCWLALAGGCLLLSLLKIDVPEVVSLHYPFAGIFHGAVIVALNSCRGRGGELIAAIRSNQWLSAAKLLVIVDAEQDPADEAGVCWRVMNNVNWEQDLTVSGNWLSIDATRKPDETRLTVEADADTNALIARRWKEYGFES